MRKVHGRFLGVQTGLWGHLGLEAENGRMVLFGYPEAETVLCGGGVVAEGAAEDCTGSTRPPASIGQSIGPVAVPACHGRLGLIRWLEDQYRLYWTNSAGCRQAKALLGCEPGGDRAKWLLSMSRSSIRVAVHMLTDHCYLKYHRYKLGLSADPVCSKCGEEYDTSIYVLSQCPALSGTRLLTLGSAFLVPGDIKNLPLTQLLNFWRRTEAASGTF